MLHTSASGYRHYASGALTNVGAQGLCWSSSAFAAGDANASSLSVLASRVSLSFGNNRAYAFPVRCVQHL
ncbi:MAG: fibrobacter succinogenes major paralogous domain-containing protein, partial [Alistipes sp.]|nr:fibrobacter succinogenes major paralogous domain-containing protein [Alistipes sp.]